MSRRHRVAGRGGLLRAEVKIVCCADRRRVGRLRIRRRLSPQRAFRRAKSNRKQHAAQQRPTSWYEPHAQVLTRSFLDIMSLNATKQEEPLKHH